MRSIIVLLLCLWRLHQKRASFDDVVRHYIMAAVVLFFMEEIAFTLYVSVSGLSNIIGHILKHKELRDLEERIERIEERLETSR